MLHWGDISAWVNPKDHGALGNGVADDTAGVQAALDSGSAAVLFPPGTYRCSALTVPATVQHLLGMPDATLQQIAAGAILLQCADLQGLTVLGLNFAGVPGDVQEGPNIAIDYWASAAIIGQTARLIVRDCYFTGWRQLAIRAGWCAGAVIEGNTIKGCSQGLQIVECHDVRIAQNRIVSPQAPSVDTRAIQVVTNSTSPDATRHNRRVVIVGNTIDNVINGEGIMCHDAIDLQIANNILTDCLTGIWVAAVGGSQVIEAVTIHDNLYTGTATAGATWTANVGIGLGGTPAAPALDCRISHNTVRHANAVLVNTDHAGIYIWDATTGLLIDGNLLRDCYGSGIGFAGQAHVHTGLRVRANDIAGMVAIASVRRGLQLQSNTYDGVVRDNTFNDCTDGVVINTGDGHLLRLIANDYGPAVTTPVTQQSGGTLTTVSQTVAG